MLPLPNRAALLFSLLLPMPALAHHAMDGVAPRTPLEGLLSGLGHPVIELDHLVFLLAVAALVVLTGSLRGNRFAALLVAFIFASALGTALHVAGGWTSVCGSGDRPLAAAGRFRPAVAGVAQGSLGGALLPLCRRCARSCVW